jgi:uncharacterized protein (DUF433 family)
MAATEIDRIQKTPNVCGGSARIGNHRITVWQMVLDRKMGLSDAAILDNYPTLTQDDLDACWDYFRRHPIEIEQDIWSNDTAANETEDGKVPPWVIVAGILLGIPDEEIRDSFPTPLTPADLAAAWAAYRADPVGIDREIASHRQFG